LSVTSDDTGRQLPPAVQLSEICSETTSVRHKVQQKSRETKNAK